MNNPKELLLTINVGIALYFLLTLPHFSLYLDFLFVNPEEVVKYKSQLGRDKDIWN
jgi:hypothetical protein